MTEPVRIKIDCFFSLVARREGEIGGLSVRRACWIRRATSCVTMVGREAQVEVEGRLAPFMAIRRADFLARTLQAAGRSSRHRPTPKARFWLLL